jgi:hypothetical protein
VFEEAKASLPFDDTRDFEEADKHIQLTAKRRCSSYRGVLLFAAAIFNRFLLIIPTKGGENEIF